MNSDPDVVGEVRISYELHSFRDQTWYRLNSWDNRAEAVASGEQLYSDQTVDGIRVIRNEYYVDYDFADTIIVFKRMMNDIAEPDPLAFASEVGLPFYWRQVSDFFRERGREELRNQLGRYLEDRRITALELVHSEKHLIDLDSAGTTVQGLLQKVAVPLAQTGKTPAASLFKEMMTLWGQLVLQLRNDSLSNKAQRLEPGRFVETANQIEKQYGAETGAYHLYRALTATLQDAKTWLEKLDRLGQLFEPECQRSHLKILDTMAADIFSAAGPFRELIEEGGDRVTALCTVGSVYGGTFKPGSGSLPRGLAAVNTAMNDGRMPRTRSALRRRILRELVSRQPLLPGRTLMHELEGLNIVIRHYNENALPLLRDEEVTDAVVARVSRTLNIQGVSEAVSAAARVTEKLAVVSRLAQLSPGPLNKATVFRHFRAVLPPDDMVRICLREAPNRLAAITILAEVQQTLLAAPLDEMTRSEVMTAVDTALLDIFKNDILLAPNRTYADRMVILFKVCSSIHLAEGKARALAVEHISREFRNPKFLPSFKARFKSDGEVKEVLLKVKSFLTNERTPSDRKSDNGASRP